MYSRRSTAISASRDLIQPCIALHLLLTVRGVYALVYLIWLIENSANTSLIQNIANICLYENNSILYFTNYIDPIFVAQGVGM